MDDDTNAVENALQSAFGNTPVAPKAAAPEPVVAPEVDETAPDDGTALLAAAEPQVAPEAEPTAPEPEFTIEVDGKPELVRGADRVRELLQKGLHYSRGSEEVARVREQLAAQGQAMQQSARFQQEIVGDISELRALDKQLEQYAQIDWNKAIDTDFTQVLKLQEQRAALKEARAAKLAEINGKQQQFAQAQEQAARTLLASEEAALLAKLPEWRNSDKATAEKQAITRNLAQYGFQQAEISNLMDHRMVLLARDAMQWRELQRTKMEKVRQVRDAPPVVKPGAAATQADPNSKAGFNKFTQEFRKQGRAGNHRAQEAALEKVLARTFK